MPTPTCDAFGNLKVVHLGSTTITYDIDGAGRRIGRTIDDGTNVDTRRYLLGEGNRLVAEYNESGNLVSQFVYATGRHVPDLMLQGSNIYRIVTDHLGSVRLVVNVANGSVAQRIDYDTWGNGTVVAGATFEQPFGFAGGIWDRDTGLVHFGAREYDPATGRWLQKDPILFRGGDTNLYAYVGGDPVNLIDPSGTYVQVLVGAGIGALWGGGYAWMTGQDVLANAAGGAVAGGFSAFWPCPAGAAIGAALGTGLTLYLEGYEPCPLRMAASAGLAGLGAWGLNGIGAKGPEAMVPATLLSNTIVSTGMTIAECLGWIEPPKRLDAPPTPPESPRLPLQSPF